MIECIKYKEINKGSLVAFVDFWIPKMGLEITGCSLHVKDNRSWVNLPSREYTDQQGEKKYAPIVRFREKSHADAFSSACKEAIQRRPKEDKVIPPHPDDQEELPF